MGETLYAQVVIIYGAFWIDTISLCRHVGGGQLFRDLLGPSQSVADQASASTHK